MFRSLGDDVQVEAKANEIYIDKYNLWVRISKDKICKSSLIGNSITQCLTMMQKLDLSRLFKPLTPVPAKTARDERWPLFYF